MNGIGRNIFDDGSWVLRKVEDQAICDAFDCDDNDLNEYFHVDAPLHKVELLTQTYYLQDNTRPDLVLALLDFCNDAVVIKKYKEAKLLRAKYRKLLSRVKKQIKFLRGALRGKEPV